jgi:hypothetical protein
MGGRGKEGELIEWTGSVRVWKCVAEANPGDLCMTHVPSPSNGVVVIGPYAAKKSLSPEPLSARTAHRHWWAKRNLFR